MLSRIKAGSFVAGTAVGALAASALSQKSVSTIPTNHHLDKDRIEGLRAETPAKIKKPAPAGYGSGLYVPRIALTGGPCGGKSSSMNHIKDAMRKLGYDVYFVPEVPTILMNGGCQYPGEAGGKALDEFEDGLMALQFQMERSFVQIASSTGRPSVVVFDRGLMDIKAYLPEHLWRELLARMETREDLLLARYDAVVHLMTAAEGAEAHYSLQQAGGEAARTETAAEARTLDARVKGCWARHKNHIVVGNGKGGFEAKLQAATEGVIRVVKALEEG